MDQLSAGELQIGMENFVFSIVLEKRLIWRLNLSDMKKNIFMVSI